MLHAVPDGENRFRLTDQHNRERGWIRGRAVRFTGFSSEADVLEAVRQVWYALEDYLRSEFRYHQPNARFLNDLRFAHDGAYEWIIDGRVPVARIFRPAGADGAATYAMELVLPAFAGAKARIGAARAMASALDAAGARRHGHPPDAA